MGKIIKFKDGSSMRKLDKKEIDSMREYLISCSVRAIKSLRITAITSIILNVVLLSVIIYLITR